MFLIAVPVQATAQSFPTDNPVLRAIETIPRDRRIPGIDRRPGQSAEYRRDLDPKECEQNVSGGSTPPTPLTTHHLQPTATHRSLLEYRTTPSIIVYTTSVSSISSSGTVIISLESTVMSASLPTLIVPLRSSSNPAYAGFTV